MNKNSLVSSGVALFVGVIVGVFVDPYLPLAVSNSGKGYQIGYQTGFNAAKDLVESSNLGTLFKSLSETRVLSGTIINKSDGQILLRVTSTNPLENQSLSDRVVSLDATTVVTKIIQKDPEIYKAELARFVNVQPTSTIQPPPPAAFTMTQASTEDIQVGDSVNVLTAEDVSLVKAFVASGIQIRQK